MKLFSLCTAAALLLGSQLFGLTYPDKVYIKSSLGEVEFAMKTYGNGEVRYYNPHAKKTVIPPSPMQPVHRYDKEAETSDGYPEYIVAAYNGGVFKYAEMHDGLPEYEPTDDTLGMWKKRGYIK